MRKVVAGIAKRTGLSPYKARKRAVAKGLVPARRNPKRGYKKPDAMMAGRKYK